MKNASLLFCVLLASIIQLPAQMTVEVTTSQDEFLPGEALPVTVRVVNRSGQTLTLGKDNSWLKFSIEAKDGYVVLKTGDAPVAGEFTLESSERGSLSVDLAPYFQLSKAGRYSVTATVYVPEWGQGISSSPKNFEVIQGSRIWEQEFGVPSASGGTPQMRRYALQEANYLRSRLTLYAQVTDSNGKINKVLLIGPMISFGQPEAKVDKKSNLQVLYQTGPRSFSYTVINPDGEIITRQTYDYTTRPQLLPDSNGDLTVVGGTRRITRDDFPSSKSSVVNDSPTKPTP